jgi:acyl carrier protein
MEQSVREIVANQLHTKTEDLDDSMLLQDVVEDSIVLIGMVAELTDKLKLDIDPVKLNNVRTVGEAINALASMQLSTSKNNY